MELGSPTPQTPVTSPTVVDEPEPTAPVATPPSNIINSPTTPPANLVSAHSPPTVGDNGIVRWAFDAKPSQLDVVIEPFVELPLASNGSPARWNAMSYFNDRLFAVDEQDGRVYEITNRQVSLWFDIKSSIQSHTGRQLETSNSFHGGVRGIAFHPDFARNGKFYASLMEQRPDNPALHTYISDQSGISADSVLVEWTANTDNFVVDPSSYREVFRVGVPEFDHPIKQILFNPYVNSGDTDFGNLYVAHGDGSIASSLAGSGLNNDALGKILRVNPLQFGEQSYTVPADNPFINDASLPDAVYSYGHRNPHHLAFTQNGHLLATEAGRDNIDEVNLILQGNNYGWPQREGTFVHLDSGTLVNGITQLPNDDAMNGFTYPVVQFGHHASIGATFTNEALGGGFAVENGSELDGEFFYIDFPKTSDLFHSSLSDMLAATTKGAPPDLSNAQTYVATVKYDHDNNPDTQSIAMALKEIVQTSASYVNTKNRIDVRILQGAMGELYLTSKRNSMVYLISNSLPRTN